MIENVEVKITRTEAPTKISEIECVLYRFLCKQT